MDLLVGKNEDSSRDRLIYQQDKLEGHPYKTTNMGCSRRGRSTAIDHPLAVFLEFFYAFRQERLNVVKTLWA